MSLASRLLGIRADNPPASLDRTPTAATGTTGWSMPGMPQTPRWDADNATAVGYYGHVYSYRCARTIATTIAGLPFRAGRNPDTPGDFTINAPLARLLGPPPGGPAPGISPRRLWAWSIAAYLVTGRYGWETTVDPRTDIVTALWPLVAGRLKPIPTDGGVAFFAGYEYQMNARIRRLGLNQVHYSWRPSQDDWREPESVLQAASLPLSTAIALDKHMYAFMKNNMVGAKMVITPEFNDTGMRRAFQDQFLSEMTGWDNAGRTAFAEWDDEGDPTNKTPSVQVVDLGTRPIDAQTIEQIRELKTDICIAYGVPVSMLGNAAQRTYENADQEHRNYWTGTILPLLTELTDDINMTLAPRVGDEVGWFDLTGVEALRPAKRFIDASPIDLKNAAMITTGEWREDSSLPPQLPTDPNAPLPADPLPAVDDTPGVGGKSNFGSGARAAADSTLVAAGLAVKAADTGRVLLLQRAMSDDDPASGTWEFPGGHIDTGEDPFAAAVREWQEETGCSLPQGRVAGSWTSPNGVYKGFVYLIAHESLVTCNLDHEDRHVLNPDDPDGDQIEVVAWWNPATLPAMSALRPEARKGTDWHLLATAGADSATGGRSAAEQLSVQDELTALLDAEIDALGIRSVAYMNPAEFEAWMTESGVDGDAGSGVTSRRAR